MLPAIHLSVGQISSLLRTDSMSEGSGEASGEGGDKGLGGG